MAYLSDLVTVQNPDNGTIIKTLPETAKKLGLTPVDTSSQSSDGGQTNAGRLFGSISKAVSSALGNPLVKAGLTAMAGPAAIGGAAGDWLASPSSASPAAPSSAPAPNPNRLPPPAPMIQTPPIAPPAAPVLPKVSTGGGFSPNIKQLMGQQTAADQAALAAQAAANPANVAAAGQVRGQVEGGIAQNAQEDQAAQDARQQFQQQRDDRLQKYQQLIQADRSDKIDPNHFWNSKDTGQKVLGALGMMFGSFGQSFGGPGAHNVAADMIDKAISQDYEAQKQNIANKRANTEQQGNFLKTVNDAGLSDVEAKDLHRMRALDTVQKNVEMLSKTATAPQAQAAAQMALAQIKQEQAGHAQNLMKTASDLSTQSVARAHMGLENQLLVPEVQMAKMRAANPGAFVNPDNVAILGGQKVNLGQGIKGEDLTKAWQIHQRLIETIDKTLPQAGSSFDIPFTPSTREGEARAGELKDALAGVSKTSPRLQKEEFANRIGSNAFSTWGATPEKLRMLRENTKSSLVDELESKGLNPTAAKAYVEQKFPTAQ